MSATPWFKFFPGDYLGDTKRLTQAQHGAYLLLLIDYYATGRPLPDDDAVLARVSLSESVSDWKANRLAIAGFFQIGGGLWRHLRCDREIEERTREHAGKSGGGKKGNEIRWGGIGKRSQSESVSDRIPEVRSQKSEVRGQKPEKSKATASPGAARLPPSWTLPGKWLDWTQTEKPGWTADQIRSVAEKFHDHWIAKPGKDGTKVDWEATWRNWVRRENDPRGTNGAAQQARPGESAEAFRQRQQAPQLQVPAHRQFAPDPPREPKQEMPQFVKSLADKLRVKAPP